MAEKEVCTEASAASRETRPSEEAYRILDGIVKSIDAIREMGGRPISVRVTKKQAAYLKEFCTTPCSLPHSIMGLEIEVEDC